MLFVFLRFILEIQIAENKEILKLFYSKKLKRRKKCMLEEQIKQKRKELNKSIEKNNNYNDVYRLSVELDELITEFYKESKQNKKNKRIFKRRRDINKILYIA